MNLGTDKCENIRWATLTFFAQETLPEAEAEGHDQQGCHGSDWDQDGESRPNWDGGRQTRLKTINCSVQVLPSQRPGLNICVWVLAWTLLLFYVPSLIRFYFIVLQSDFSNVCTPDPWNEGQPEIISKLKPWWSHTHTSTFTYWPSATAFKLVQNFCFTETKCVNQEMLHCPDGSQEICFNMLV